MRNSNFTKQFLISAILILLSTFVSNAQNWYQANNPFGGNILAMHETNDDVLFAGTKAGGVQKKEGSSWTSKNQGVSAIFIERFISIDGILYACTDYGVYISEDGGQSWQQSLQGMDDTEIVALAKAPNGDLYAGGDMLYRSENGFIWTDISQGFPDSEVTATDILIEPDGRIIMATDEYGISYSENQGQNWNFVNTGLEDVIQILLQNQQP